MTASEYRRRMIQLLETFEGRAKTQGWDSKNKKYLDARMEFMIGAMSWEITQDPKASWPILVLIAVGRPTQELIKTLKEA